MDVEALMKAMKVATSNVFETMFFLPMQFAEKKCTLKEWFSGTCLLFGATLSFEGPLLGSLWLIAPVSVVSEITTSFLGIGEHEINDEQRGDTVKEALNIIGGSGFTLFDRKRAFALGIPQAVEGERLLEDVSKDSDEYSILIDTGQHRLAAGLHIA